jgi:hypothetical protein
MAHGLSSILLLPNMISEGAVEILYIKGNTAWGDEYTNFLNLNTHFHM